MNPFPNPRSVIVWDNVNTHRYKILTRIIGYAGVKILYLPPYSPFVMPIELLCNFSNFSCVHQNFFKHTCYELFKNTKII